MKKQYAHANKREKRIWKNLALLGFPPAIIQHIRECPQCLGYAKQIQELIVKIYEHELNNLREYVTRLGTVNGCRNCPHFDEAVVDKFLGTVTCHAKDCPNEVPIEKILEILETKSLTEIPIYEPKEDV